MDVCCYLSPPRSLSPSPSPVPSLFLSHSLSLPPPLLFPLLSFSHSLSLPPPLLFPLLSFSHSLSLPLSHSLSPPSLFLPPPSSSLPPLSLPPSLSSTATLAVGNCLPLGSMPEGTIVCGVEEKLGDRGKLAKASGNYATIVAQNPDAHKTRVKLPSGAKKVKL